MLVSVRSFHNPLKAQRLVRIALDLTLEILLALHVQWIVFVSLFVASMDI
jgi:hypothetical protein